MAAHRFRAAAAGLLALCLAGCSTLPAERRTTCALAAPGAPQPRLSADGRTFSLPFKVATYNVEGLAWPARRGRSADLSEIGRRLAEMRDAETAPDVVLFQEVFRGSAERAVGAAGYPNQTAGPPRGARRDLPNAGVAPGRTSWSKGEIGFPILSGGLTIASRYPILAQAAEPFSRGACAGLDCLANKGALFARIGVPGVPDAVELYNTHMNSSTASRAARPRTTGAHRLQGEELEAFMAKMRDPSLPVVLGGDFNMRRQRARFANFEAARPLTLVHQYCVETRTCDVAMSWDGDAPWMDTNDLQYFGAGKRVHVRPVKVESLFDGRPDSPKLSDHDAFMVTYELSWPVAASHSAGGCASTAAPKLAIGGP